MLTGVNPQRGMIEASRRAEYFPVYYVEPLIGNRAAAGFDLASNPVRLAALERARDTGEPVTTGRITLVQETGRQFGFLIFFPVYQAGAILDTPAKRREALRGFTLGVYRIGDMLTGVLGDPALEQFEVTLHDSYAEPANQLLYHRAGTAASSTRAPAGAGFRTVKTLSLPGREWRIAFDPRDVSQFGWGRLPKWSALGTGLLVTGLLAFYLFTALRRAAEIRRQVTARTEALSKANLALKQEVGEREKAEQAVRGSEARLGSIVEHLTEGIAFYDADDRFLLCNSEYRRLNEDIQSMLVPGTRYEDVVSKSAENHVRSGNVESVAEYIEKRLEQHRNPGASIEHTRPDGGTHQIREARTPDGGTVVAFTDITDLKNRERELRRSNTDLEQFAYVASHDLQEPLRMVASYTQLLQTRYQGKLDDDADEFIGYAVDGAKRMQTLLRDLLGYSRVGSQGKPLIAVDSGSVAAAAIDNLKRYISEAGARVEIDPLPEVLGDEGQLIQLFQNLVANGVKFRGEERAVVRVSGRQESREWEFSVRDNGIGISPEYAERIFTIFQRLHSREEYPGTGIGLAVCKRIVERHGGRIWVESEEGGGATFKFTLQAADVLPLERSA